MKADKLVRAGIRRWRRSVERGRMGYKNLEIQGQ